MKRKKTSKIPKNQRIMLIIFSLIFIISGSILLNWFIRTGQTEKTYQELAEQAIDTNQEETSIDFEKLKNINPEVVGWIKIDGTTINYPIMQHMDNTYYLNRNFYKKKDDSGSVFLDYKNQSNFTDKNIVIYGHNIKRGIIFSDLEKIYQGKLKDDVSVNIYTPEKTMKSKVFSSYEIDPENYAINTNVNENEFDQFKQTLSERTKVKFIGNPNESNQILTLSTCDRTGKKRILVHAELEEVK